MKIQNFNVCGPVWFKKEECSGTIYVGSALLSRKPARSRHEDETNCTCISLYPG